MLHTGLLSRRIGASVKIQTLLAKQRKRSTIKMSTKRLATIILVVSVHLCYGAKHETVTKTFQFPNKRLVLAEPSFNEQTLVYALCTQPIKQCTVVQEVNPFVKTPVTKKCDITDLHADNVQLVVAFGKDKAILVTEQPKGKSTMLKAITVHMNNCKHMEEELFEIPSSWKGVAMYRKYVDVVTFENGFELVVKGFSQICSKPDKKVYCGFIFDAEGKKLEGPIVWPKMAYDDINIASPIIADAQGQGYIFINEEESLIGIQVDRKGGPTYTKLWGPMKLYADYWSGGYSTANHLDGMCYAENSTIRCWQNSQGSVSMKTEVDFKHEHKTWNIYVHNLKNGGFVLMMITCPDRVCSGEKDHYYFMRIDAQGKLSKPIDVNVKSNCNVKNGNIMGRVYENEQGLFCTARMCKGKADSEGKFEAVVDCYSEEHFTK